MNNTTVNEPFVDRARSPFDEEVYPLDRAYLPRNFRTVPPLQDRLSRIYYEARQRAALAAAAAANQRIDVQG